MLRPLWHIRLPRPGNVAENSSMPSPVTSVVDDFEAERPHLLALAYRMLGSRAEAEDVVQEAWLRYSKTRAGGEIHDVRGWLTTVTGRLSLDVLRSARVRREAYPGQWLPEPMVTTGPAETIETRHEVGLALLVVLEKLTPEQRVAVVLHDAFAVPFDEIADVLNTSVDAARQHASRGRRAIAADGARHTADLAEQRRVLAAFLSAAASGDLQALAAVLAPDVVAIGDGGGVVNAGPNPVFGADKVARFYAGIFRLRRPARYDIAPVLVNGDAGWLLRGTYDDGRALLSVMGFAVADGRITAIYNQLNPAKLASVADLG
jgi:RNA polymerase sigma-70 factor (ECF subfamily)